MSPRAAARLAWLLWALAFALSTGAGVFLVLSWSTPPPAGAFGFRGFAVVFAVAFGTVGALVASRQPRNPIGWLALATGIASGIQGLANEYAIWAVLQHRPPQAFGEFAAWFPAWIWIPATAGAMFILLAFPNGHLLSPRWRFVVGLGITGVVLGGIGFAVVPGPLENFHPVSNPFGLGAKSATLALAAAGQTIYGISLILSAVAVVLRFRRSRGDERQQMKWLVAAGVFLAFALVSSFVGQILDPAPAAQVPFWVSLLVISGFSSLPVAMGFAILKYRLYDIDVVISKAVVYGTLAAVVTMIYLTIVVGVGAVAGSGGNVFLSAVAAAVVAVAFQPLRGWAQRVANRIVYGKRATPYEVLSGFSERLGGAYSIDDVLPQMAKIVADGTGAARVGVWVRVGDELRAAASWPDPMTAGHARTLDDLPDQAFEVRHHAEPLGAITVAMPPSEPMTFAREKLIADVAAQAGLVLRNVALLEDLRESRRRIVSAQDDRARALERNIHDGAQQQLVALAVKAKLAQTFVERDPGKVTGALEYLQRGLQEALEDLRDLARGIYPPLLVDKDLGAALEAQARKAAVPITVETDGIGRYPADVEATVYFCALEALNNVAKYANASQATIKLDHGDGRLMFTITDDGVGFDPERAGHGTGLQGMADRLAAIGGALTVTSAPGQGTRVEGSVPTNGVTP